MKFTTPIWSETPPFQNKQYLNRNLPFRKPAYNLYPRVSKLAELFEVTAIQLLNLQALYITRKDFALEFQLASESENESEAES